MTTPSLSKRAMLASVQIHCWAAARTDKKITREIADTHAVNAKRAGRYRKYAIDPTAASFEAVGTAASGLRGRHYFYTLPWSQDGARILPCAAFEEYSAEMRKLRVAFERAVQDFVNDYPALKLAAQRELKGMYNEADYPTDMAAKFGVDIGFMPLPDAEDFRASLSEQAVAQIKRGIETEVKSTLQLAMHEPYKRLYAHITRMVERLSDKEAIFRDTLVTGLADLCAILPALNLTQDPQLEDLRQRAQDLIAHVRPQDLRDVPATRQDVARKAAAIQSLMAPFMGAAPAEAA